MKQRKHVELIKAWADGAEIEFRWDTMNEWKIVNNPHWEPDCFYRIKPMPKPDVIRWCNATIGTGEESRKEFIDGVKANLKLTFDGETGLLKSSEIL